MKSEDGFSYVEVLVSLLIFFIFLTPVLLTVERASAMMESGATRYKAQILICGLLLDVEEGLNVLTEEPSADFGWISGFGRYDFDRLYETDFFQYQVYVYEISGGEKNLVFYLGDLDEEPEHASSLDRVNVSGITEAYFISAAAYDRSGRLLYTMSKVVAQ